MIGWRRTIFWGWWRRLQGFRCRTCWRGRGISWFMCIFFFSYWSGVNAGFIVGRRVSGSKSRRARLRDISNVASAISDAERISRAGLQAPNRPMASFLFLGRTGVGKVCLPFLQLARCWCGCDRRSFAKLSRRSCSMMSKGGWSRSTCPRWVLRAFVASMWTRCWFAGWWWLVSWPTHHLAVDWCCTWICRIRGRWWVLILSLLEEWSFELVMCDRPTHRSRSEETLWYVVSCARSGCTFVN